MYGALLIALTMSASVAEGHDLSDLVAKIRPAVVKVTMRGPGERGEGIMSIRSGVVIDSSGFILTSVPDLDSETTVQFHDGLTLEGELIAHDPIFEVALVKVQGRTGLTPLPIAEHTPKMGEQVLAVGFSAGRPGGSAVERLTMAAGIVGGDQFVLGENLRFPGGYLRTDIALDPSMNLLFAGNGDLVSVMPRPPRRGTPATFYYPLPDIPRAVFASLWAGETISHGWLGVVIKDVDSASATELELAHITGTVVMSIHRPAGKETALKSDDVILEFNGVPAGGVQDLQRLIIGTAAGTVVPVLIHRKPMGQMSVDVEVLELPTPEPDR